MKRMSRNPALPSHVRNLNKRQRKKQRVGEFTDVGFTLQATLSAELDVATQDSLLDDWLVAIDEQQVSFGGQFSHGKLEGTIFPIGLAKIDEGVRTHLLDWLKGRSEVVALDASALYDIWHDG